MDWEKRWTRRTIEGAGDYPGVQLQLFLQRLEMVPAALPAIAATTRDIANWHEAQRIDNRSKSGKAVNQVGGYMLCSSWC